MKQRQRPWLWGHEKIAQATLKCCHPNTRQAVGVVLPQKVNHGKDDREEIPWQLHEYCSLAQSILHDEEAFPCLGSPHACDRHDCPFWKQTLGIGIASNVEEQSIQKKVQANQVGLEHEEYLEWRAAGGCEGVTEDGSWSR